MVALETPVLSGRMDGGGLIVETGGASPTEIAAKVVINAAGWLARPRPLYRRDAWTRSRPSISPRETISLWRIGLLFRA